MRKFLILILFNIIHFKSESQDLLFPINPGSQNYLSGNLGELRSDHFHMGLDIKTYGRINVPVYASDDGYIERVRVSGTGYGKALYLKHNDGYKSVYAHLNSFHKDIENIDFSLSKNSIKVQSGNSKLMIFKIEYLIHYISQFISLEENDIIFSGTPKGVDKLKVGDKLEGYIENEKILNINII